jgi:hypothetical protein
MSHKWKVKTWEAWLKTLPLERAAAERAEYYDQPKQYKSQWLATHVQAPVSVSEPVPVLAPAPSFMKLPEKEELFGPSLSIEDAKSTVFLSNFWYVPTCSTEPTFLIW